MCRAHGLLHPEGRPLFGKFVGERSDLLFILEAPNLGDTIEPDKGYLTYDRDTDPTGRFFRALFMDALGEPIETAVITNSVLCLPAESRGKYPVTPMLSRNCASHLRAQVEALDPLIVVALGNHALAATRRLEDHKLGKISLAVGRATPWLGRTLLPLYHPGLQVRNNRRTGRSDDQQREDWSRLKELLAHERRRALRPLVFK
jgi:uracil-DNA glycosylase family 4